MKWIQYNPSDESTWPPIATHVIATWLENGKGKVAGFAMLGLNGDWIQLKNPPRNSKCKRTDKIQICFDEGSLGWAEYKIPDWWKRK